MITQWCYVCRCYFYGRPVGSRYAVHTNTSASTYFVSEESFRDFSWQSALYLSSEISTSHITVLNSGIKCEVWIVQRFRAAPEILGFDSQSSHLHLTYFFSSRMTSSFTSLFLLGMPTELIIVVAHCTSLWSFASKISTDYFYKHSCFCIQ